MVHFGSADVHIGCQSWSQADWSGIFYPPGLKPADRLASYARVFDFVEIDSSFYTVPPSATVRKWRDSTPPGFRFAAKLPQAITHDPDPITGLPRQPLAGEGWREHLARFMEAITVLGEKLLTVVVQLPPQWHWDPKHLPTLQAFLEAVPKEVHWAVEFRHRGWLNDYVFRLLEHYNTAFVVQDLYYMPKKVVVTSPELTYIRLLGRRSDIKKRTGIQVDRQAGLDFWAATVSDLVAQKVKTVVVAANDHYQGFAPGTVVELQRRLGLGLSHFPSAALPQLPLDGLKL